jgi:hypothetical protein
VEEIMKKIITLALVALSFSSSAFAAALATHTVTTAAGQGVYGGTTATEATNASNPLVRFSTGVYGVVNFTATNNLSSSYALFAKHYKGSKIFGTANDSTNIYWKAEAAQPTGSPAILIANIPAYRMAGRDRRRGDMENPVARVSEESGEARLRTSQLLDCWRTKALGRWLEGEPAQLEGRPARGRTHTIPKSPERQPRKADAGQKQCPY